MPDRWKSLPVKCVGGINQTRSALEQGANFPGEATYMINYEPDIKGGYTRVLGYSKYDDNEISGSGAVLGVKVALNMVFGCRGQNIYKSSGSGWTQINSAPRIGGISKYRIIQYSMTDPVVVFCDGFNHALKYDGAADTLLNGAGAPADPKYAAFHLSRLVLAGYSANLSEITISAPDDDEVYSGSGAIAIEVGDEVRGLKTFRETLYIFCKRSIWRLEGTTSADFVIRQVTNDIGCDSCDTIQEVDGDLFFLFSRAIRSLAATERIGDLDLGIKSGPVTPAFATIPGDFTEDQFSTVTIPIKNQFRGFLRDSNTDADSQVGWIGAIVPQADGSKGWSWSVIGGFHVYCSDSDFVGQGHNHLAVFGTPTSGYVYEMESGNSRDGSVINAYYQTPQLVLDDADIRKVLMKLHMYIEVQGDMTLTLTTSLDYGNLQSLQPPNITITQDSSFALYGTAIYGTDIYTYPGIVRITKNLVGSGYTVSFIFSSSSADLPPHRIDSFQLDYTLKGYR